MGTIEGRIRKLNYLFILQKCNCPFPIARTSRIESRSTSFESGVLTPIITARFWKDPGPTLEKEIVTIMVFIFFFIAMGTKCY